MREVYGSFRSDRPAVHGETVVLDGPPRPHVNVKHDWVIVSTPEIRVAGRTRRKKPLPAGL
jgi:hypothetical protein